MRVVEVRITNIRSIDSMVLKPGVLTVLEGSNGVGKTSVLLAIKAVFAGGHSPELISTGAKRAEVVLVLDNGTTIKRVITEKSSKLDVTTQDGMPVPEGPQHFVETLASGFAFDPLAFIEAKPKERLAYLQRALNLTFTPSEVAGVGLAIQSHKTVDLDGLESWRKQVYEARTKENTLVKQAQGTVERLSAALSEDETTDWPAEVARLQEERDGALLLVTRKSNEVSSKAAEDRAQARADYDRKLRAIEADRQADMEAIATGEMQKLQEIAADHQDGIDQLTASLATAQERARKSAQLQVFRAEVENAKAEAAKHESLSKTMTERLAAIDALKRAKLDSLPISGVEIKDGEFYCDGLPFDSLNTGAQYLKAFEVGALQPGSLGLMIADKLESLGPDKWDLFKEAATQSGFQVFATRVSDGPLLVSTESDLEERRRRA